MYSKKKPSNSFISPDQNRSLFIYEKRLKRFFKSNRKIVYGVLTLLLLNFIYNLSSNSGVQFELDDEYLGTYKEKYLKTIKSKSDIYTDEFYSKLRVMGFLDDIVNEPIEKPSFNSTISPYEVLKKMYPDPNVFTDLTLKQQAEVYTNNVLPQLDFQLKPIQDTIYRDIYYPKKYLDTRLNKWIKIKQILTEDELKALEIDDNLFKQGVLSIKDQKTAFNENSSNEINNSLKHLKFFSRFFLKDQYFAEDPDMIGMCQSTSRLLFPWLSGHLPLFEKYNKRLEKSVVEPFGEEGLMGTCFVQSLQSKFSGKGIVITAYDKLVPELTGLLSLLRILNNQLPIQIVHKDDLTLGSIKKIIEVATEPVMNLPPPTSAYKLSKIPTLDITFVDVSKTVASSYRNYFTGFSMKLLAYMFNSFEEMIMLDTDTVPLLPIEQYFGLLAYKETSTLFFRDREANSFLYDGIMDMFTSYLNTEDDYSYLQLRPASEETLGNRFFSEKARHFMESGLFAINKKNKFDGVLASVTMQLFRIITGSIHGDKELIWLGQEIMGETYRFNTHPVASVGALTDGRSSELVASELCSTHPGHLGDDGKTLLWFNSGFLTCKKADSYYKDINYEANQVKTLLQLKKEYLSPIRITAGLIPPPAEYNLETDSNEPSRGWVMTTRCECYMWCAYDIIGGGTNDNIPTGTIIMFSEQDTNRWEYFGEVWVRYYHIGKGDSKTDLGYVEDDAFDELGLDDYDTFEEESASLKKSNGKKTGNTYAKGGFAGSDKSGSFGVEEPEDKKDVSAKSSGSSKKGADSLTIKKPTTGSGKKTGMDDAFNYEEYESSHAKKAESSKSSKKAGGLTISKGKKVAGDKPVGKIFTDADFIDSDEVSNTGKSKGFKETETGEYGSFDIEMPGSGSYSVSPKASLGNKKLSDASRKAGSHVKGQDLPAGEEEDAEQDESIGADGSSLQKASKNINSFFNSFGLGYKSNRIDSQKLSSFGDDSEIGLVELASPTSGSGSAASKEKDVLRAQLLEEASKDVSKIDVGAEELKEAEAEAQNQDEVDSSAKAKADAIAGDIETDETMAEA